MRIDLDPALPVQGCEPPPTPAESGQLYPRMANGAAFVWRLRPGGGRGHL